MLVGGRRIVLLFIGKVKLILYVLTATMGQGGREDLASECLVRAMCLTVPLASEFLLIPFR